jgi:hypothetical protein
VKHSWRWIRARIRAFGFEYLLCCIACWWVGAATWLGSCGGCCYNGTLLLHALYRHEPHPGGTRACLGDSVYTYKAGIALINISSRLSVKGHATGDDVILFRPQNDQSYTSIPFHRPLQRTEMHSRTLFALASVMQASESMVSVGGSFLRVPQDFKFRAHL